MSWNDFYRRRDVLVSALKQAERDPDGQLPFTEIPDAREIFGTKLGLLWALQHQWTRLLSGYLRAEGACPDDAHAEAGDRAADRIDPVSRAWRKAAKTHATLRAVLDAHVDEYPTLLAMHQAEQRMLAVTAGLAEPGEPDAAIGEVGLAFDALRRYAPAQPPRRWSSLCPLSRVLARSA